MNHKLKAFIFILLLFIPTYLAVASYIGSQDASIEDSRAVVRMSILDPDGGTYVFTPNSEGEDAEQQNKEAAAEIAFLAPDTVFHQLVYQFISAGECTCPLHTGIHCNGSKPGIL